MLHFRYGCDKVSFTTERPPMGRPSRTVPRSASPEASGPPIQESLIVTSPAATTDVAEATASTRPVRRSRKALKLALVLVAVTGFAFATAACSPEMVAKDAIAKHWGGNASCAERIVARESNFQADAVNSYSGATGLFQMMPLHKSWISKELGYSWSEMKDPYKNAQAAKLLSHKNYVAYGDGWAPWRLSGRAIPGGGCPA